jgi:hypothetical protein
MTKQIASFSLSPEAIQILDEICWVLNKNKSDYIDLLIKASYTKEVKNKVAFLRKTKTVASSDIIGEQKGRES